MKRVLTIRSLIVLLLALFVPACIAGRELSTGPAVPADVEGTYTLLLYGCHYPDDIKDLAILVSSNGKYPVEIYDLPTSYKTKKDLPGAEALKEAESFVRCSTRQVSRTQVHRIYDETGGTVGFEIRPLYFPLQFGRDDVFLVNYTLRDGRVTAYIRLDPGVQRVLESSGNNGGDQGK